MIGDPLAGARRLTQIPRRPAIRTATL